MGELRWHLGLYHRLIAARMRSQVQYRLSFALDVLGTLLITGIDFLAILVLFAHLPRLAGWTLWEVGFFYGVANISFTICDMLVGHLDEFSLMIRQGSFDLMLIRPVGSMFQVIASDLALRRLGRLAQGVAVLAVALVALHLHWTAARVGMLAVAILSGTFIYIGVWILTASISFWTLEIREVANAFTYGGSYLASYPINIFSGWLRRLLAFVIPLAFVSYFPGLYVLDHPDPLHTPAFLPFLTPLVAVAICAIAYRSWQFGVRHYRSTGS